MRNENLFKLQKDSSKSQVVLFFCDISWLMTARAEISAKAITILLAAICFLASQPWIKWVLMMLADERYLNEIYK